MTAPLDSWYMQSVALALAVLSYLLLARLAIDVVIERGSSNVLVRALRWITGPFVRAAGALTPRIVPDALITGSAVVWIFAARVALVQVAAAMAMRRMMG
jgi:hypothetical protein